jgi:hypothetical protein
MMFALFRVIVDRLKALFVADAGLEFEAEFVARDAERKAQLLRQAAGYEKEGLRAVAEELRRRAEAICLETPLAAALPALGHFRQEQGEPPALLPFPRSQDDGQAGRRTPLLPAVKKKGTKT